MLITPVNGTLSGILRSMPRTWWPAFSGCYDAAGNQLAGGVIPFVGPVPATPVAAEPSDLDLGAGGEIQADLTVRCNRQGMAAPDAAGLLVGRSGAALQGCDVPQVMTGTEPMFGNGSGKGPGHILRLRSGGVGLVYVHGVARVTRFRRRDPTTGLWSAEVTLSTGSAEEPYPFLLEMVTDSGAPRLAVIQWSESQVRAWYSLDDGTTWNEGGEVLEEAFSSTTYPFATRGRLRAAWNPSTGAILLVGHLRRTGAAYADVLIQWASTDGGAQFQRVFSQAGASADDAGGYPDITIRDGVWNIGYIAPLNVGPSVRIAQVSDAWQRIDVAANVVTLSTAPFVGVADVAAGPPITMSKGELALWLDDDLALYLLTRNRSDNYWPIARNILPATAATDWRSTGPSAAWVAAAQVISGPQGGDPISAVSVTAFRGQSLGTFDHNDSGELHILTLGGWSTLTMPSSSGSLSPWARVSWDYSTPWTQSPGATWWGGFVGGEVQEPARIASTGPGTYTDGLGWATTLTTGAIFAHDLLPDPLFVGVQARLRCTLDDGANKYAVEVVVSAASLQLRDLAGGLIGVPLVYPPGRIRVAAAMTSTGFKAWYRSANPIGHEEGTWTEIGTTVPIAAASTGAHFLDIEITAATVRLYWSGLTPGQGAAWLGMPGISTLYPRPVLPTGVWAPGNINIVASTGPAFPGETWTIARTWEYGPSNLDPRGDSPSPAAPCLIRVTDLPAGTATIRLAWEWSATDEYLESDLIGAFLDGMLSPDAQVYHRSGGAWVSISDVPSESFAVLPSGRSLVADLTVGGGTSEWIRGDLDGAACTVVNAAGLLGEAHIITRSRGGSTITADTHPLHVELDTAPAIVPAVATLWPRRALVTKPLAGTPSRGIQIRIPVHQPPAVYPGYPPGGYYGLSVFSAGPVLVTGTSPADICARAIESGVEVQTAQDRTRSASQVSEPSRILEVRWDAVSRDALQHGVASSTAGVSVAYYHDLDGILELTRHEGPLYPSLYAVDLPTTTSWRLTGWGTDWLYGRSLAEVAADPLGSSEPAARVGGWVVEGEA